MGRVSLGFSSAGRLPEAGSDDTFCTPAKYAPDFLSPANSVFVNVPLFQGVPSGIKPASQSNNMEEGNEMKADKKSRKKTYAGAGAGIVLFAIKGVLPGSFLGGVIGLNIAGGLFGAPASSMLLPRFIVGLSMLLGVLISGIIFIAGTTAAGWLIGYVVGPMKRCKVPAKTKK